MLQNHYELIKQFYGDRKAERSQVPLINHIDEGLIIMDHFGASGRAKAAYCLHPIVQSDKDFLAEMDNNFLVDADHSVLMLTIEYRAVANSYLSPRTESMGMSDKLNQRKRVESIPDVRAMLLADKIQNRKDFEIYHKGSHPRSDILASYFNDWMTILNVMEPDYKQLLFELFQIPTENADV